MVPKDLDDWSNVESKEDAPAPGLSRELLRKALSVNPAMRDSMTTESALDALASAGRGKAAPVQNKEPPRDLALIFHATKQTLLDRKRALQAQITAIEAEMKTLEPQAFETLYAALVELDPNLTGLQTAELFRREEIFLRQIGLTAQRFMERKLSQNKKK